nr:MAG TPA: hypothetical protein [Caudoviricetes sp.]
MNTVGYVTGSVVMTNRKPDETSLSPSAPVCPILSRFFSRSRRNSAVFSRRLLASTMSPPSNQ